MTKREAFQFVGKARCVDEDRLKQNRYQGGIWWNRGRMRIEATDGYRLHIFALKLGIDEGYVSPAGKSIVGAKYGERPEWMDRTTEETVRNAFKGATIVCHRNQLWRVKFGGRDAVKLPGGAYVQEEFMDDFLGGDEIFTLYMVHQAEPVGLMRGSDNRAKAVIMPLAGKEEIQ